MSPPLDRIHIDLQGPPTGKFPDGTESGRMYIVNAEIDHSIDQLPTVHGTRRMRRSSETRLSLELIVTGDLNKTYEVLGALRSNRPVRLKLDPEGF